jgi:hypothetical protein
MGAERGAAFATPFLRSLYRDLLPWLPFQGPGLELNNMTFSMPLHGNFQKISAGRCSSA